MSILPFLSSSMNKRDNKQNKKLAAEIAHTNNSKAIKELVENLSHHDKNIQSDCIDTLYETGYIKPQLIADYYKNFLALLESKNNRMVWGGMIALSTITDLKHKELFDELALIMQTVDKGSVITIDCGVIILAKLSKHPGYSHLTFPLLLEQLRKCPIKQLPMYAERSTECITNNNKKEFIVLVEDRLRECDKDSQRKRLEKILKYYSK